MESLSAGSEEKDPMNTASAWRSQIPGKPVAFNYGILSSSFFQYILGYLAGSRNQGP